MQKDSPNDSFGQSVDEKLFRLLVDSVKDYAIFMIDPAGYIMSWNYGAARIKGYREEEIIGKHISIFYTPEDIENNEPQYNLDQALKKGTYESEGWRVRKNGSIFWANILFTPLFDGPQHIGFAKVTRDCTERKIAEEQKATMHNELEKRVKQQTEQIISSELRFRKLIENSYSGIALLDEKFHVFYRSLSAERINGWTNDERLDVDMSYFIHPDDQQSVNTHFQRILKQPGVPVLVTYRSRHRLGHYIWLECLFTNMLNDEDIKAIVCNFSDVTKRTANENEVMRQNSVLRDVSWIGSHEIRRPVASIMGLISLINASNNMQEKEELIGLISNCASELDEMVHLINDKINNEL